ncbi:MAG: acetate--CoA ligase family protein, partial [Proteobacteria bacterium]|nr:acetate--CoA ligase family protein [Pseudomonadota bacterium]
APPAPEVVSRWRARLATGAALDEAEGLDLIADFGVPAIAHAVVGSEAEALAQAERLGYPVALKTAVEGIQHKSDVGGVHLNLSGPEAVRSAYGDLAARLGPRAMLSPMAPRGVEMSLGIVADPQFGPLVMVGSGGILVELLADRRVILPPCSDGDARRHIDRLKARRLLDGMRGQPAADVAALARAVAALSVLAGEVGDLIAGLDINPVIVGATRCVAVDALVIPRTPQT